jgi:hypothetical protein
MTTCDYAGTEKSALGISGQLFQRTMEIIRIGSSSLLKASATKPLALILKYYSNCERR